MLRKAVSGRRRAWAKPWGSRSSRRAKAPRPRGLPAPTCVVGALHAGSADNQAGAIAALVPAAADSRRPPAFPRPQRGQGKRERGQGRTPRQAAQRRSPRAADREQAPAGRDSAKKGGDSRRSAPPGEEERPPQKGRAGSGHRPPRAARGGTGPRPRSGHATSEQGKAARAATAKGDNWKPAGRQRPGRRPARRARSPPTAQWAALRRAKRRPGEKAARDDGPRAAGEAPRQRARDEANGDREAGGRSRARRRGRPKRAAYRRTAATEASCQRHSERRPLRATEQAARSACATDWQLLPSASACGSRQLRTQVLGFDARAGLSMTEQTSVRPRSRRRQIVASGRQGGRPRGLAMRCSFVNIHKKCLWI